VAVAVVAEHLVARLVLAVVVWVHIQVGIEQQALQILVVAEVVVVTLAVSRTEAERLVAREL
jgi:hypothetical protein